MAQKMKRVVLIGYMSGIVNKNMNKIVCSIREPISTDENKFILAMQRSQTLHHLWIASPKTSEEFKRSQQNNQKSFLVLNQTEDIAGVFNVNEIVHSYSPSIFCRSKPS